MHVDLRSVRLGALPALLPEVALAHCLLEQGQRLCRRSRSQQVYSPCMSLVTSLVMLSSIACGEVCLRQEKS